MHSLYTHYASNHPVAQTNYGVLIELMNYDKEKRAIKGEQGEEQGEKRNGEEKIRQRNGEEKIRPAERPGVLDKSGMGEEDESTSAGTVQHTLCTLYSYTMQVQYNIHYAHCTHTLCTSAAPLISAASAVRYSPNQRLLLFRESSHAWEPCTVLKYDVSNGGHQVYYDSDNRHGDSKRSVQLETDLGLKVHYPIAEDDTAFKGSNSNASKRVWRIGQRVRERDDNGRPTGKQGAISR
jgi:hypothetical protein